MADADLPPAVGMLRFPVAFIALLVGTVALYALAHAFAGPAPPSQDTVWQALSMQGLTLLALFLGVWGTWRRDASTVSVAALVLLLKAGLLAVAWSPVFFVEAPACIVFALVATQLGGTP